MPRDGSGIACCAGPWRSRALSASDCKARIASGVVLRAVPIAEIPLLLPRHRSCFTLISSDTVEAGRRAGRTRRRDAPPRGGPGHHVTRSGGATVRKGGMLIGAGVTIAGVLAVWLLPPQDASGEKPRPRVLLGPLPCPATPADLVALSPLEQLGKKLLYDCFLSDPPATLNGPSGYA